MDIEGDCHRYQFQKIVKQQRNRGGGSCHAKRIVQRNDLVNDERIATY